MDTSRTQLRERIARKYALTEETIRIGSHELSFTRAADPDAVLDAICLEEEQRRANPPVNLEPQLEPLRMPYWAAVWESANALGEFALSMDRSWRDARVLDLGCGMGNAGMILAAAGANVTLVDIDRDALLFAELNIHPWRESCSVKRIDWNVDRLSDRYELILGSDVLYEREQWDGFEAFIKIHLDENGIVLIGEPGRAQAEAFPDWIRARGWSIEMTKRSVEGRAIPINLFTLRRSR
ncbi:MAG TPA: methyltransferase domain-containing protein [Tepidisphaeraceae bacterium]|nr:methyltransferase domain-containing protein [Tepidisphaeraceae bacterium]